MATFIFGPPTTCSRCLDEAPWHRFRPNVNVATDSVGTKTIRPMYFCGILLSTYYAQDFQKGIDFIKKE